MAVKILIIRFRQLGDSVLSSALCSSIKRSIPDAEIHYVLNKHIAPIFKDHPDIDRVISFDEDEINNMYLYLKKVWSLMRKEHYSVIIDTRTTIKTMFFSAFSLGSKYRIGRYKYYSRFFHNFRIDNLPDGKHDNVTLTLKLLDPLVQDYNIKKVGFYLNVSNDEVIAYRMKMMKKGIDFNKPVIFTNVTAKLDYKRWDQIKMTEVLNRILDKYRDVQLVLNYGSEKEKTDVIEIFQKLSVPERVFIDIEAKNTRELMALIANCNLYFGNEGGSRHISQALSIPSFAIYGPKASKTIWLPFASDKYQGMEALDVDPSCREKGLSNEEIFDLIDANSVWDQLDMMLSKICEKSLS